ncbi:MAG TPA: MarC family protein [Chloroflexota bacterium]|nr:MarC family protein [Chloroflexota bacterium]
MAFLLSAVVTIFIVVDPIALTPLFIGLTGHMTEDQRRHLAYRSVTVAGAIMLVFVIVGRPLLAALGISLDAFYIAGGALLFLIAIDLLFARPSRTRETPEEEAEGRTAADISVFPLAIPIISGPGAIATIVLFMSQAGTNLFKIGSVLVALLIALVASLLVMRMSGRIMLLLRTTGIAVIGRVMGLILAALAAQFVLNGIHAFMHRP